MKTSKGLLCTAAVVLATAAFGQSANAHVREVKVFRGAEAVEVVPVVGQKAKQRGKVLKGEAAEVMATASGAGESEIKTIVGGKRLWLVDHAEGEVVGCRLSKHLLWDLGSRIRCTRGDLPE